GIRDATVTGVQTCALPISSRCATSAKISSAARLNRTKSAKATLDEFGSAWLTVESATCAASSIGYPYAPAEIAGNAIECTFNSRSEERRVGKEVGCRGWM